MQQKNNSEVHYEYEDLDPKLMESNSLSKPLKMGMEEIHYRKRDQALKDFMQSQANADLKKADEADLSIKEQLFGIGAQYKCDGVSLDEKYFGHIVYQLHTDHMLPWLPPKTDLLLKFCSDFASGEICVYRFQGETYCNQIWKEGSRYSAVSFNKKYKPIVIDSNEFFLVGVILSVHYSVKGL